MANGVQGLGQQEQDYQDFMKDLGQQWATAYTPAQQFRQYATTQMAPGMMRDAFYGLENPLTQRYMMASPFAGTQPTGGDAFQGFGDWVGGQSVGPGSYQNMLQKSRAMAALGQMTGTEFTDFLGKGNTGFYGIQPSGIDPAFSTALGTIAPQSGADYNRLMWQRYMYGTGAGAAENQMAAAQALAMMNPATGMQYGGPTGQAITSALSELQQVLMGQQLEAGQGPFNFLDWYTRKMARTPTQAGGGAAGSTTDVAPPDITG